MKTALVFSAGGMFGAYQAGAWKVLEPLFRPDLVVGASIGSLNGWAVAGGCSAQRLIDEWLHLPELSTYPWRIPRGLHHGFLDSTAVETLVQRFHQQYRPRTEFGVVLTDTLRMQPVLFSGNDISWQHLAASAAIPGVFTQQRIGGRLYSDGGLLCPNPLWAAAKMGAQRIISLNILPVLPAFKNIARIMRKVVRFSADIPVTVECLNIESPFPLGSPRSVLYWRADNVKRWIEQGERDTENLLAAGKLPFEVAR